MPISPFLAPVPPRGHRRTLASLGLSFCLALGWGCAKQAEGERCDLNNGDLDCDTGLRCKGEAELSIQGSGFALCCPITGDTTTVNACRATADFREETPPEEMPAPMTPPDAGGGTTTPEPVVDAGALPPDATPAL